MLSRLLIQNTLYSRIDLENEHIKDDMFFKNNLV